MMLGLTFGMRPHEVLKTMNGRGVLVDTNIEYIKYSDVNLYGRRATAVLNLTLDRFAGVKFRLGLPNKSVTDLVDSLSEVLTEDYGKPRVGWEVEGFHQNTWFAPQDSCGFTIQTYRDEASINLFAGGDAIRYLFDSVRATDFESGKRR
jgi:hypothetical protein